MKNLLNAKSIEERSDLLSEQASRPYSSTGNKHEDKGWRATTAILASVDEFTYHWILRQNAPQNAPNNGSHLIMHRTIGLTGYIGPLTPTLTLTPTIVR